MIRTLHEELARQREQELLRRAAQERLARPERDRPPRAVLRRLLARRQRSTNAVVQTMVVVECTEER